MRALNWIFVVLVGLVAAQYVPAYYRSSQFEESVRREVMRTAGVEQLKRVLLERAGFYSIPVQASDIKVTTAEGVLRVDVRYTVPVNLGVYRHNLQFRTTSAGLLPR